MIEVSLCLGTGSSTGVVNGAGWSVAGLLGMWAGRKRQSRQGARDKIDETADQFSES